LSTRSRYHDGSVRCGAAIKSKHESFKTMTEADLVELPECESVQPMEAWAHRGRFVRPLLRQNQLLAVGRRPRVDLQVVVRPVARRRCSAALEPRGILAAALDDVQRCCVKVASNVRAASQQMYVQLGAKLGLPALQTRSPQPHFSSALSFRQASRRWASSQNRSLWSRTTGQATLYMATSRASSCGRVSLRPKAGTGKSLCQFTLGRRHPWGAAPPGARWGRRK
jgi:hypothetical protein